MAKVSQVYRYIRPYIEPQNFESDSEGESLTLNALQVHESFRLRYSASDLFKAFSVLRYLGSQVCEGIYFIDDLFD